MAAQRTIEYLDQEECGCFIQRIHDTWMGEEVEYDNVVLCPDHC